MAKAALGLVLWCPTQLSARAPSPVPVAPHSTSPGTLNPSAFTSAARMTPQTKKTIKSCEAGAGWLQTPMCGRQGLATHTCPCSSHYVWGWGAGKGPPGASKGLAAATQLWDCAGTGPHGQSRVCHLHSSSLLPGPVAPSLPRLSAPGAAPGIQGSCSKYKEWFCSARTRDVSVTARAALKATGMGGEVGRAADASARCTGGPWYAMPVPCVARHAPLSSLPGKIQADS